MKIVHENFLLKRGDFHESEIFKTILSEIRTAISHVSWPENEQTFSIRPERMGNGVKPIKNKFIKHLINHGWKDEIRLSLVKEVGSGPIDAIKNTDAGIFAVEWETGNISSSHRALNKIAMGILQDNIIGGILILPVWNLAQYLTDRIGNYEELKPYFPLYDFLKSEKGLLLVISVDYDDTSSSVPLIPKGKDGNSKGK